MSKEDHGSKEDQGSKEDHVSEEDHVGQEDRVLSDEAPEAQGSEFRGVLATTQERVAEILLSTEKAAAEIVEAANAESAEIVRETHARAETLTLSKMKRIDSLTEALLAKAGALESEVDGLRDMLRKSIEELAEQLGIEADSSTSSDSSTSVTPNAAEGTNPAIKPRISNLLRSSNKRDRSEAVKLLATQMMAAGHTREETHKRLSEEFGVKDPGLALDEIGVRSNG